MNKISLLQRKAVRILTFSNFRDHTEPLFKEIEIFKVQDNIFLQNCLFVYNYFHGNLPDSFKNTFNKVDDIHSLLTRNINDGSLALPNCNSTRYGLKNIYKLCIDNWNTITKEFKHMDLLKSRTNQNHIPINLHVTRSKLKQLITDFFLDSYEQRL